MEDFIPSQAPTSQLADPNVIMEPTASTDDVPESESSAVKQWIKRIKAAKRRWQDDFDRMKENRQFAFGYQWVGQKDLTREERYICNMIGRAVNQKVASYYARNPKAVFQRRPRLDFELWDGSLESLAQATQAMAMSPMPNPNAMALLQDFNNGRNHQRQVERIGKTLEILYQWNIDQQEPEFKKQMKALVRRVCACGVGYVKMEFVRAVESTLDAPLTVTDIRLRQARVNNLLEKLQDGDIDETSPEVDELKATLQSMLYTMQSGEAQDVHEHLVLSFPKASSVIPDKDCTNLKDFVGARFIAEERILPLSFVQDYYELRDISGIKDDVTEYNTKLEIGTKERGDEQDDDKLVCVWEVQDKRSKTRFTLLNGYKQYLVKPEPIDPCTHRFWNVFSLAFNDSEYEPGDDHSIFPPSDVQLMRSAQKEYNRSREALRNHRKSNEPRWAAKAGVLSEKEKDRLQAAEPHDVIQLNLPENMKVADVLQPIPHLPIEQPTYVTDHLERDVELAAGIQQANMGPAQPNVTATVGSIAEQSRMTSASSNVDDLDDMLSDMARAGGEILLKAVAAQTVARVVGPGFLWPDDTQREDFLNEIFLNVAAASSGRPNKGVEMSNMREMMPLLMQAGANPEFLVEEMVQRWDDNMDVTRAFPLVPPQQQGPPPPGGRTTGPGQQGPPSPQGPGAGQRPTPPMPQRPGVDNQPPMGGPS